MLNIRRLSIRDVEGAARLLAEAFHNQPYDICYQPDDERRMELLLHAFRHHVSESLSIGEPLGIGSPFAGVALAVPPLRDQAPGVAKHEPDRQAVLGKEEAARAAPLRELIETRHKQHMPGSHWYLPIIGVAPGKQGTGVGSALLRAVTSRALQDGMPCYLDTAQPRNVPFYLHHGFQLLSEEVEPISGLSFWTFRTRDSSFQ